MSVKSLRLALLAASGGLAACTAEPRYPIHPGEAPGGGFGVEAPRYPVRPDGSRPPPAPAPAARPPQPPSDDDAPRASPSRSVETEALPPPPAGPGEIARLSPEASAYRVAEGDTLYGVARRFGLDPRAIASLNERPFDQKLRTGEILRLPPRVGDKGAVPGAMGALQPEGSGRTPYRTADRLAAGAPPPEPPPAPPASPLKGDLAHSEPPAPSELEVAALARGRFNWPIKGAVISSFGPKGPGQRNDGVNIAAEPGEIVKAAASGVVVYAGNSIPAFGNLVLIKHPGGWATLYGNLGKITVSANAQVAQGQEVGVVGMSGAVDRPQVHFEIRYAGDPKDKAKPYDPTVLVGQSS